MAKLQESRTPPQNTDAEMALLGGILGPLRDSDSSDFNLDELRCIVSRGMFEIWSAIPFPMLISTVRRSGPRGRTNPGSMRSKYSVQNPSPSERARTGLASSPHMPRRSWGGEPGSHRARSTWWSWPHPFLWSNRSSCCTRCLALSFSISSLP